MVKYAMLIGCDLTDKNDTLKSTFNNLSLVKSNLLKYGFSEKNITKETINYWNLNSLIGEKKFDENKFFEGLYPPKIQCPNQFKKCPCL